MKESALVVFCCLVATLTLLCPSAGLKGKESLPVFDPKKGKLPLRAHAVYALGLPWHEVRGTPHHIRMKTNKACERLGIKDMPIYFDVQRYSPGGYQEPRGHRGIWHLLYVLEGEGEFRIGRAVYKISPGTWCYIPEGTVHAARNTGKGDLVMLFVGKTESALEREQRRRK